MIVDFVLTPVLLGTGIAELHMVLPKKVTGLLARTVFAKHAYFVFMTEDGPFSISTLHPKVVWRRTSMRSRPWMLSQSAVLCDAKMTEMMMKTVFAKCSVSFRTGRTTTS